MACTVTLDRLLPTRSMNNRTLSSRLPEDLVQVCVNDVELPETVWASLAIVVATLGPARTTPLAASMTATDAPDSTREERTPTTLRDSINHLECSLYSELLSELGALRRDAADITDAPSL